ncbi:PD-(D/E)XK nuclease family protein [Desulfothermus naphthae]
MSKIKVVHPKVNLLLLVAEDLLKRKHLSNAHVIFPNKRSVSFFEYYLSQKIDEPTILPVIQPIEDWVKNVYILSQNNPPTILNEYDQAYIAYLSAKEVFKKQQKDIPKWDNFFPWALRLVKLFEELDLELGEGKDIYCPPEEALSLKAIEILEQMGQIYNVFNKKLKEKNYITYAKMLRYLSENSDFLPDSPIYLVGFYALTQSEDKLFKNLYEREAYIYWHADPEQLPELYKRWQKRWEIKFEGVYPIKPSETEIYFFEAHDLHAELDEIKKRLPEKINNFKADKIAIVTVNTENLIPIIYHLPPCPINITMGYPIKLSGIFVFLEAIFDLILGKDENRGYALKDLIAFFRSPYLKDNLHVDDILIEYGAPYVGFEELIHIIEKKFDEDSIRYIKELFEKIIFPIEKANCPLALCRGFRKGFDFIQANEDFGLFEQSFLDSIVESVLYVVEESLFADKVMEKGGLFNLFKELISNVRVPFEGEPLVGIQVMGLLETRLLNFEEIFVLDVNEGVLPQVEEVNPLLPEQIRTILGLPNRQREEVIIRYHFERLINTAKKVHLFWQHQTTRGTGQGIDSIKVRSRYVEKLIWDIEKKEGVLFDNSKMANRFKGSFFKISPQASGLFNKEPLKKDIELKKILIQKALSPISPSTLRIYLECPLKFFYSKVLDISYQKSVDELSYEELGIAVHEALEDFYKELLKKSKIVEKKNIKEQRLLALFEEKVKAKPFYKTLSEQRRFLLFKGAEFRLKKYIENHPEKTKIICLEREFEAGVLVPDIGDMKIFGRVDRVDFRDGFFRVLDYKTGYVENVNIKKGVELDVSSWIRDKRFDLETLKQINEHIPDLQLPVYAYLFARNCEENETNPWDITVAAYVKLRDKGEEEYFLPLKKSNKYGTTLSFSNYGEWLKIEFPKLLKFIVMHIIFSEYWYPAIKDGACSQCDFSRMCRYES